MANRIYNKQVSPKGYRNGGRVKKMGGGSLKAVPAGNKGLKKLPTKVRNKMGFMQSGGVAKSARHPHSKLKTQKELKKITGSDSYKKASYGEKTKMLNRATHKDGGMARRRNTSRMNRLEELGRVDAEKGFTRKGKKNLRAERKRIIGELKK